MGIEHRLEALGSSDTVKAGEIRDDLRVEGALSGFEGGPRRPETDAFDAALSAGFKKGDYSIAVQETNWALFAEEKRVARECASSRG
jgi:hypothetical protein